MQQHKRIIISGGGTGGHIFPAISIANAVRKLDPDSRIKFVGARGRMEMERVPEAGYEIEGLPVAGFIRGISLRNLEVMIKLLKSLRNAKRIVKSFNPDAVVGVGGYASGPILWIAAKRGIPTLIQEQNSYAGLTNRVLARRAKIICVAYDGMEKYFPREKLLLTGNPVRQDIKEMNRNKEEAIGYFGLKTGRPVILVLGGSLGSGTINASIAEGLDRIFDSGLQIIWQTGKYYFEKMKSVFESKESRDGIVVPFIDRMEYAFTAADMIVSRAGAGTISELYIAAKPVILVPSPNVAEDHQTRNALSLSCKNAAILVHDRNAGEDLVNKIIESIINEDLKSELSANISQMAIYDADVRIAEQIIKMAE
ncbi:MAG TPA: undecaprenyldiphospho-muramoylpentapeptide beta-N-acetylglucosaminyltransferase [Bacteroidales bacterium]|nr:undecaprenyldiphospho-muramoylpentapeptide beta-N-acetylglucosaminyltransferase [Bacteroidales bacterium]